MLSSIAGRICGFFLLLATSFCVVAQEEMNSAFLTVAVSDTLGGAIPNARVQILQRSPTNEKELVTGEAGNATVELQAGTFDLTVTSPGFRASAMHDVKVKAGERRRINVVLKVLVFDCCIDFVDPIEAIEPERAKLGDLEEPTDRGAVQDSTQSTSSTPHYFPPEQTSTPVLSVILPHLGEPSLFEAAKNANVVSFRASYFSPVPTREMAVRLIVNADGSGQITAAVSTGTESGVKRTQNDVSIAEVNKLLRLVAKVEFWSMSSTEDDEKKTDAASRRAYVMDGSHWMVEGVHEGLFHYVYRQNPKPSPITEIACNLAKDLAKPDDSAISNTFCAPRGH